MGSDLPIGVFDSGVGGISVLKSLVKELPEELFLYYGDTMHAPYGTKSVEEVMECVDHVMDFLLQKNIKALVIACNTASAVAAQTLRSKLSIPVIAMEPALKPAAQMRKNGQVLVLATPVTLRLEKFKKLYAQWGNGAIPVPCPGLMEMVEKEDFGSAQTYLQNLFSRFSMREVDGIVLGCTHYVFLKPLIKKMCPDSIFVIDGNEGTARQLRHVLTDRNLLNTGKMSGAVFYTSGCEKDIETMRQLFQHEI